MIVTVKEWRPAYYISERHRQTSLANDDSGNPYALLILNQPIRNKTVFSEVSRSARYVVCADGGANRLREISEEVETCIPNAICGDLDSVFDDVKDYYQREGAQIIKDPDQYSTDFTKCLTHISSLPDKTLRDKLGNTQSPPSKADGLDVAVIGGLGGRADQAFSQLHQLFAASQDLSLVRGNLYLITTESIIFVLEKGLNRIYTPVSSDLLGENVGIVPLGRPSLITTRGLEWDVTDWATEFGGRVSTSNHIKSEIVEIETSERVVFTVELALKP